MRFQKLLALLFSMFILPNISMAQTDLNDAITNAIKSGNIKEISKYFDSSISLKILDVEDIYSKAQAEIILKDFLVKNPVKNYSSKHSGTSKNGSQYIIGQMNAGNKNFRTYYFIKKSAEKTLIQELKIENEN